jgi:hypothetical protein
MATSKGLSQRRYETPAQNRARELMKMIAARPYTAQNPDREGGDTARTTLPFSIIFDGADAFGSLFQPRELETGINDLDNVFWGANQCASS